MRTFFVIGIQRDTFWMEEESRNIPCCMVPMANEYEAPFTAKPPYFVRYCGPRECACAGPFEFAVEAWDYAVSRGAITALPEDGWITVVDKRGRPIFSA